MTMLSYLFRPREVRIPPILWLLLIAATVLLVVGRSSTTSQPTVIESERIVVVTATPLPQESTSELASPPDPDTEQVGNGGTLAFTMRHNGNSDIYLLPQDTGKLIRLTYHAAEDRNPVWSPDGRYLAFTSQRGNNWDIYSMDMESGTLLHLTRSPDYEANPTWSPDGQWLAYERYIDGNLEIFIQNINSNTSQQLTSGSVPNYSPAWSPDGRHILYTSYRDENKDLFIFSLDNGNEINVTRTPNQNEDYGAWSPDGTRIIYSAGVEGDETIWQIPFVQENIEGGELRPVIFSVGGQPTYAPDGSAIAFIFRQYMTSYLISADTKGWGMAQQGFNSTDWIGKPSWTLSPMDSPFELRLLDETITLDEANYTELIIGTSEQAELVNLPDVNNSNSAEKLSDEVNDSYNAMRQAIHKASGWDYLAILGDSWRPMEHIPRPGQGRISWHVCGRAIDIDQGFFNRGDIELIREDIGGVTYWRVYILAKEQDGSLGEPLREAPWDIGARSKGGEAYVQGGELKDIPPGYYVEFTRIAADYGWERRNALGNWRTSYFDVEWWHFQKTEGLSWYDCMAEMYSADAVDESYGDLPWWTKQPEWEVQSLP